MNEGWLHKHRGRHGQLSALLVCLLPFLLPGNAAARNDPALRWKHQKLTPKPLKALVDCRSPVVPHESHVELGASWQCGDVVCVFTRDRRGRLHIAHGPASGTPSPRPQLVSRPPALVIVQRAAGRYGLSVRDADDGGGALVSSAHGIKLKLKGGVAHIVDSDLDGVLGSPGDGYVAPGSRTVAPWSGVAWTALEGIRLRKDEAGRWQRAELPVPYPEDEDHSGAWRHLQWIRQRCGLLPTEYDASLEDGMRKHAEYLHLNDTTGHAETPGQPGYTVEGAQSGKDSILSFGKASVMEGLLENLATLYHRDGPLSPGLERTAMVLHKGTFLLNQYAHARGPLRAYPLVYPPHGMVGVRTHFNASGERPMPVKGVSYTDHRLGTAIGVFAIPLIGAARLPAPPTLSIRPLGRKGRPGKEVEASFHYPGFHPGTGTNEGNLGEIAATPHNPLERDTTYRCRVNITFPSSVTSAQQGPQFDYSWEFTTQD